MTRGALLVAGCLLLAGPLAAQEPPPAREVVATITSRTLVFEPSRDDVTVGTVWFNVYCSRPAEVRVNGEAPASSWHHLELERVGRNRFALPDVVVEAAPDHDGLICLSVKVWFEQVDNQYDGLYYERLDDRYALVAFATRAEGPDWEGARPRFSQNRAATLRDFLKALERPFRIPLNDRPLPDRAR